MAEALCNDLDLPLPEGLLADLTSSLCDRIRADEVARARRHVAARAYDGADVVEALADRILLFSRT